MPTSANLHKYTKLYGPFALAGAAAYYLYSVNKPITPKKGFEKYEKPREPKSSLNDNKQSTYKPLHAETDTTPTPTPVADQPGDLTKSELTSS
ncbi:unnamed protein product [Cunninghamella echinulata]